LVVDISQTRPKFSSCRSNSKERCRFRLKEK
jgi:hypothetical protein